jgi:hypothetical protein
MSDQPSWERKVPKSTEQGIDSKPINRAWEKAKNNDYINVKEAWQVKRVWNPYSSDTKDQTQSDLERLVEKPLQEAVQNLWLKGIVTNWSDVWNAANIQDSENQQRYATIGINILLLSPSNLEIFEKMKSEGIINDGRISFPVIPTTSIKTIEEFFIRQTNRFFIQKPSDFTDKQIFDIFSGCYSTPPEKLKLISCSLEEYNNLPAIDIIKVISVEYLFGDETQKFLNYITQEEMTVKEVVEMMATKNPNVHIWNFENLFYDRQDAKEIEKEFEKYKNEFRARDKF